MSVPPDVINQLLRSGALLPPGSPGVPFPTQQPPPGIAPPPGPPMQFTPALGAPRPPGPPQPPQPPPAGGPPPGPAASPMSGGPAVPQDNLDALVAMLSKELGGYQGAISDKWGQYQQGAGAYKDLLANTAQRLSAIPFGPSQSERMGRLAQAMGAPTRTGTFGERMGNVGGASADVLAQQRQADIEKELLRTKYLGEAAQLGMQIPMAGMGQLTSLMNNAQTRLGSAVGQQGNLAMRDAMLRMRSANQPINVFTGQPNQPFIQARADMAGAEAAARMHAQMNGITGQANDQMQLLAQRIAAYKSPMPTQTSRTPYGIAYGQALNAAVLSYNPDYDATTYPVKLKTINSFMGGKDGTLMTSLNTAIQHLALLHGTISALNSGDVQWINDKRAAVMGAFGSPLPTNVRLVQNIAAEEVNRIATGGPGAEEDRNIMRASVPGIRSSPDQAVQGLDHAISLMAGRTYALRQRWKAGTKLSDAEFDAQLTPETRAAMERHGGGPTGQDTGQGQSNVGQGKTVTKANVEAYAKQHGLDYQKALEHVQTSGFTVQ